MNLLLRRDQRMNVLRQPVFSLEVRADITDDDRKNISKYGLSWGILYTQKTFESDKKGWAWIFDLLKFRATTKRLLVKDLADGKRLEFKNIVEMLQVEEEVRQAAVNFAKILRAAQYFGGEEVVPI
jgi:hypothetical protein